jgi:hypothetical protein
MSLLSEWPGCSVRRGSRPKNDVTGHAEEANSARTMKRVAFINGEAAYASLLSRLGFGEDSRVSPTKLLHINVE